VSDAPAPTTTAPGGGRHGAGARPVAARARIDHRLHRGLSGEEQGLSARATRRASTARPTPTIQGCSRTTSSAPACAENGVRDPHRCACSPRGCRRRCAPSAIPPTTPPLSGALLTSAQSLALQLLQLTGGENDSASRQLGRFVKNACENDPHRHDRLADQPARPLPARQRQRLVPDGRLHRGALHRAQRDLRARAPERARRERRPVRRSHRLRRLRLHGARGRVNACALWSLAQGRARPRTS
jgi:hypothetical protein